MVTNNINIFLSSDDIFRYALLVMLMLGISLSIIYKDLIKDIENFHLPGKSEVALLIIDEWNLSESYILSAINLKRFIEIQLRDYCKANDILMVLCDHTSQTVPWLVKQELGSRSVHIKQKYPGVLHQSDLLKTLRDNKVETLIVLGGAIELCIHETLVGGVIKRGDLADQKHYYPGLLSCGFTVMTAAPLLTPYARLIRNVKSFPKYNQPWKTKLACHDILRSDLEQREKISSEIDDISSLEVDFLPLVMLQPGFRYYRSIFGLAG